MDDEMAVNLGCQPAGELLKLQSLGPLPPDPSGALAQKVVRGPLVDRMGSAAQDVKEGRPWGGEGAWLSWKKSGREGLLQGWRGL